MNDLSNIMTHSTDNENNDDRHSNILTFYDNRQQYLDQKWSSLSVKIKRVNWNAQFFFVGLGTFWT